MDRMDKPREITDNGSKVIGLSNKKEGWVLYGKDQKQKVWEICSLFWMGRAQYSYIH